jgi:competence protein ComEA
MKEVLKSFFSLSSQERKGVVLLIFILLMITCINALLRFNRPLLKKEDNAQLFNELKAFEQQLVLRDNNLVDAFPAPTNELAKAGELFPFDPNNITAGDLRRLGLENKQIRTLLNYRLHGGRFRQKEDLKKIYGLSNAQYERLVPFVRIPEKSPTEMNPSSMVSSRFIAIDLNNADAETLEKLPGIGPILSNRIVRYRTLLGGFYDTGQLNEVYGLSDSLILLIENRLYTDTSAIVRLSLNTAQEYELARHPYIGKFTARGIVSYRAKVQKINSPVELKINGLVSDEVFERLKKYLSI